MSDKENIKLLVCGPVQGSFTVFNEKLTSLQKSNAGPFDLCLCVGSFFGYKGDESMLSKQSFPFPIYFLDAGVVSEESAAAPTKDGITQVSENVYRLGGGKDDIKADIVSLPHDSSTSTNTASPLVVAYVSPHTSLWSPGSDPLKRKARLESYMGCDVLLTSDWGQGMLSPKMFSSHDLDRVDSTVDPGSYDTAEFAVVCRPRYHFACSGKRTKHQYVSSFPFVVGGSSLSSEKPTQHACRFVSMGSLLSTQEAKMYGNDRKFLHALAVSSITDMSPMELHKYPSGTVMESPYTGTNCDFDDGIINKNWNSGWMLPCLDSLLSLLLIYSMYRLAIVLPLLFKDFFLS